MLNSVFPPPARCCCGEKPAQGRAGRVSVLRGHAWEESPLFFPGEETQKHHPPSYNITTKQREKSDLTR